MLDFFEAVDAGLTSFRSSGRDIATRLFLVLELKLQTSSSRLPIVETIRETVLGKPHCSRCDLQGQDNQLILSLLLLESIANAGVQRTESGSTQPHQLRSKSIRSISWHTGKRSMGTTVSGPVEEGLAVEMSERC